jgi:hypothetical protein
MHPGWYAILSTEPPKMPEPELRLPEGWEVEADVDREDSCGTDIWFMEVIREGDVRASISVIGTTRRECVEEMNRMLEGK